MKTNFYEYKNTVEALFNEIFVKCEWDIFNKSQWEVWAK